MIPLSVKNSLVRILSKRDDLKGLGFLIDDQHIMTCAHVVGGALGVRAETIEMPSSSISLDFPFIEDSQALEGSVIHWRPPKPHSSAGEVDDIAVLHLNSKKPEKATPVIPLMAKKLSGHRFQTFGYPEGYGNFPVFSDGIMGEQGPGGRIQIESLTIKGLPVQKGFSGSPVWDEALGGIVGIVVGSMERDWISFIIPTVILKKSWPSLTTNILGLNSIPKLPDHIVRRQNQVNEINEMLLSKCSDTKDAKIVGIYGMGGSGKSIIAAMAVLESEVQENFPDGIFWIKLGNKAGRKLAERQSALMTSLGYSQAISDIDDGKKQLIKIFEDLTCLIVLDDLLNLKQLKAFDITGQNCRMLITTRDADLLTPIGAKSYHLPLLNDEESIKLLADSANEKVNELPIEAQKVREKCGNLPLALAMIGGMVSSKLDRWDNVYRKLDNADIGKLKYEFKDHDYDYTELMKSVQVSIEALAPVEQNCYLDFAVFPEDTPIPENTLINFWKSEGIDEEEVKEILERFVSLSLIMRSESTLNLHNIQHYFVKLLVKNQAKDLRSLHNRFLKAYGEKANWPLIADDGYFFKYLSYHLIAAGRLDDLKELLLNIKWMSAKMKASGITSLISDYDYLKESDEFRLIQGALQLSAHILNRDPKQLPSQLYGRLIGHESPQIQMFLKKILKFREYFWLRPCFPSLAQSGDPLLQTILSHAGYIIPFAIASKGKRVILGLDDGTIRFIDPTQKREPKILSGHLSSIKYLELSPTKKQILSISGDETIKIWDIASEEELKGNNSGAIKDIKFIPNSEKAFFNYEDKILELWDLSSKKIIKIVNRTQVQNEVPYHVRLDWLELTTDGKRALILYEDGALYLLDINSGNIIRQTDTIRGKIIDLRVTPDSNTAVLIYDSGLLLVIDLKLGAILNQFPGRYTKIFAINDYQIIASIKGTRSKVDWYNFLFKGIECDVGAFMQLDLNPGKEPKSLQGDFANGELADSDIFAIIFSRNGKEAIFASKKDSPQPFPFMTERLITWGAWDLVSGELKTLSFLEHSEERDLNPLCTIKDGKKILFGDWRGRVELWDLETNIKNPLTSSENKCRIMASNDKDPKLKKVIMSYDDGTLDVLSWVTSEKDHCQSSEDIILFYKGYLFERYNAPAFSNISVRLEYLIPEIKPDIKILKGHSSKIHFMAFTPDHNKAMSASEDGTIILWDMKSSNEIDVVEGNLSGEAHRIILTKDNKKAFLGFEDGTIRAIDFDSGDVLEQLPDPERKFYPVDITSNGERILFSSSDDRSLIMWEPKKNIIKSRNVSNDLNAAMFSNDGKKVIIFYGQMLSLWNLDSDNFKVMIDHTLKFTPIDFIKDKDLYIYSSNNGTINLLNIESGEKKTLIGHSREIAELAVTPDFKVVSTSEDGTLRIWDLHSGSTPKTLIGHSGNITDLVFTSNNETVVSASEDCTLKIWDPEMKSEPETLRGHSGKINSIDLAKKHKLAVSASDDNNLIVWDLDTFKSSRILNGHTRPVTTVTITQDGSKAVSASEDGTLKSWDPITGDLLDELSVYSPWVNIKILDVVITPDGTKVITASDNLAINAWDLTSRSEIKMPAVKGNILAITPDGRKAVAAYSNVLRVWNLEQLYQASPKILKGNSSEINGLAFSSDGQLALSSSLDGSLRIWNLEDVNEPKTFYLYSGKVISLAISSECKKAVSTYEDGTLILLDTYNAGVIAKFSCDGPITKCIISHDCRKIAATESGKVHLLCIEGNM